MVDIVISEPGFDTRSATKSNVFFTSKYPFTKLDTTNDVSFQTISLFFNAEPPQPPGVSPYNTNTLVYKFPHGYKYIPSIWFMWQSSSPLYPSNPPPLTSATVYYEFGDDTCSTAVLNSLEGNSPIAVHSKVAEVIYNNGTATFPMTDAVLYAQVDNTNISLYIMKISQAQLGPDKIVLPVNIVGLTLNIRMYVFTEPATTSTY